MIKVFFASKMQPVTSERDMRFCIYIYIYIYSAFAGSHDMAKIRLKTVVSFKKRKRMHFVI